MNNPELSPENPPFLGGWPHRHYQNDAFREFNAGKRRQIHIWHRRAGKDTFGLNLAGIEAQKTVGTYWHLFPLQTQAKKAIWDGLDGEGHRIIDRAFPQDLRVSTNKEDMMIKFKGGSTWQMAGSDRYNSLVGSNVRGVVFSEWALCNPVAWDYIRPILRENHGWVVFITTYRGRNHAYQMYENLKDHPDWFCSKLTVDDTHRLDGSRVLTEADIQAERDEGMREALVQQEYYCSPEASYIGAYFSSEMTELNDSTRRGAFGYDPSLPLFAAFDRATASVLGCVLVQPSGNMHNIVASQTWENTTVGEAFIWLKNFLPFGKNIQKAIMPPTANLDNFKVSGVEFEAAPNQPLIEAIDTVRRYLPLTRIDVQIQKWAEEGNNIELLNSLQGYRADDDPKAPGMYKLTPAFVPEIYLTKAFMNYCLFADSGGIDDEWGPAPDYALQDRAAGIRHQAHRLTDSRGYKRASP